MYHCYVKWLTAAIGWKSFHLTLYWVKWIAKLSSGVHGDPVLDSLLSNPEKRIHLRWYFYSVQYDEHQIYSQVAIRTNQKCNDAGLERPDGVVSIVSQSNWGRNYCHGEVKVADKKEDKFLLAWDLVRLASFNKSLIDEADTPSALAFQLKGMEQITSLTAMMLNICFYSGHKVTFYIMELMAEGLYAMTELTSIALPRSAQELSNLVSKKALRELSQVAYVFENIEKQSIQEACKSRKKQGPSLAQLGKLLSERKDRNLPCTLHF